MVAPRVWYGCRSSLLACVQHKHHLRRYARFSQAASRNHSRPSVQPRSGCPALKKLPASAVRTGVSHAPSFFHVKGPFCLRGCSEALRLGSCGMTTSIGYPTHVTKRALESVRPVRSGPGCPRRTGRVYAMCRRSSHPHEGWPTRSATERRAE